MPRTIELEEGNFTLEEEEVDGFLEREVKPIGTSGRVNVPKRFIGRRAYVVICKE